MSLVYWFPLTSDLHNRGLSSLANASVQSGCSLSSDGKLGGCYKNTGTTANVATPISFSADQFTLCAWVRIDARTNGWHRAVGLSGSGTYMGMVCENTNGTSVGFHYYKTIDGTNTSIFDTYPCSPTVGVWYHYAMCYDGTRYYVYLNGSKIADAVANKPNIRAEMTTLWLFGGTNNNYVKDSINDVRIYSHCLSPLEVAEIAKGMILHYPMTGGGRGCDNLLKYTAVNTTNQTLLGNSINGAWKNLPLTTIDGFACYNYPKSYSPTGFHSGQWLKNMSANTTYTYSAWLYFTSDIAFNFQSLGHFQVYNSDSTASDKAHEDVVSARIYEPSTIKANTWTKVRITFTTNNLAGSYFTVYPRYNVAANVGELYFRDCKLELSDHSTPWIPNNIDNEYTTMGYNDKTEYDVSGYLHNGTLNGSVSYSSDTTRYSVSTKITDGRTNYISCPIIVGNGSAITINVWMKSLSGQTGFSDYHIIFCIDGGDYEFSIPNSGKFRQGFVISGSRKVDDCGSVNLLDTSWHMLSATFDGASIKRYIDGQLVNATSASGTLSIGSKTLYIGRYNTSTYGDRNILTSDFRLYATALSAEDIQKLYNTSASIANNGVLMSYEFAET